jgi:hypothetical protein
MHDVTWLSEEAKRVLLPLLSGWILDSSVDNDGTKRPSHTAFCKSSHRDLRGKR